MSDHSLRGYLQRRATKELQAMLLFHLRQEKGAFFEPAVHEIENLLQERYSQEPPVKTNSQYNESR